MLTVTFRNGYQDTVRAVRSINQVLPRVRFIRRLAYVCLGLFVVLAVAGVRAEWTVWLLFVPAVMLAVFWLLPFYVGWLSWKNPTSQAEQRFTFSESEIEAAGAASEAHVQWSAVTRVGETRRHFVFFTSNQCGYTVPKRALPGTEAVAQLRDLLQRNAGRPNGGPTVSQDTPSAPVIASAEFQWTQGELYRAIRSVSRYGPRQWPIYLVLFVMSGWFGAYPALQQWRAGGWAAVDAWAVYLALLPLLLITVAAPLSARWAAYSLTRTSPSHGGVQTVSVTEDGVRTRGSLYTGQLGWSGLTKAVETEEFFLLYVAKAQAMIIPKRALDEAGIGRVREVVHAHLDDRAALLLVPA